MGRTLTLGLAQMDCEIGALEHNMERVASMTREAAAKGAQLVVFPELILTGYNQDILGPRLLELALSRDDEPIQRLARLAGENGVYLVVGFIERRETPGVIYDSVVFCGPDGKVIDTYAKSHLFATERFHFRRGDVLPVYQTRLGKLGLLVCYDIGFPEVGRIMSLQGAELLLASTAWITQDQDLWALHLRARALDNLVFVAGVNRSGEEGNLHYIGQSMLVNPRGHVVASLDHEREGVLVSTIDLDEVIAARRRALHWTDRRPELYGPMAQLDTH